MKMFALGGTAAALAVCMATAAFAADYAYPDEGPSGEVPEASEGYAPQVPLVAARPRRPVYAAPYHAPPPAVYVYPPAAIVVAPPVYYGPSPYVYGAPVVYGARPFFGPYARWRGPGYRRW